MRATAPRLDWLSKADLDKAYDAQLIERDIYAWWEAGGFFKPRSDPARKPFVISIPPPNVTGALHAGHGLTNAIEDLLIRWHRMLGDPTLWVPGTDHAGIATQAVVERLLAREGKTRQELGRDLFVENVWEWKDRYHARITEQSKRMGISADWDRERFTMDDGLSFAVRTAFKRLYDDGLIYRGTYLVNWCSGCGSAISDEEVIYRDEPEQGSLWYIRYKIAAGPDDTDWQTGDDGDLDHDRHHAAGNFAWRYCRGGAPGRRALPRSDRQARAAAGSWSTHSDHRRPIRRARVRHRRAEDHAGARPQRLRGGPAPPSAER